jgi:hypothetical protein
VKLFSISCHCTQADLKFPTSDLRLFSGLSFATARPSKPPAPKPSCPKGLSVTRAPGNAGPWMCCKNSDCTGYCKNGQAPFPYGPRRKLVCCQCPTGQVLNGNKDGCVSTGVPSPSTTPKPTPSAAYEPTPSPSAVPEPTPHGPTAPPTDKPTPPPTHEPTPLPSYQPTPLPNFEPTPPPTQEPTPHGPTAPPTDTPTPAPTDHPTSPPPVPGTCEDKYILRSSGMPLLSSVSTTPKKKVKGDFQVCCINSPGGEAAFNPKFFLFYEVKDGTVIRDQAMICYCINGQTWHQPVFDSTENDFTLPYCG